MKRGTDMTKWEYFTTPLIIHNTAAILNNWGEQGGGAIARDIARAFGFREPALGDRRNRSRAVDLADGASFRGVDFALFARGRDRGAAGGILGR